MSTLGSGAYYVESELAKSDVQAPGTITWAEHLEAWQAYDKKWRCGQTAERIVERGGFDWNELVEFLGREPTTWLPRTGSRK